MFPGRYSEMFGLGERLGGVLNLGHSFDAIEAYLILALAERARACRDFVEVRVRIRRHGQKFRARGGASMCEVLRRGKWRGPPPPAVKVALDDSLGPRPAFAPRTGQFVVP